MDIELMADVNSGFREIDETDKILKELGTRQRRGSPLAAPPSTKEKAS
jgi:hypothetical protein